MRVAFSLSCLACVLARRQRPTTKWFHRAELLHRPDLYATGEAEELQGSTSLGSLASLFLVSNPAVTLRTAATSENGGMHSRTLPRVSMSEASTGEEEQSVSSPSKPLRVAVAGATGRVGRLVVQELLENGHSVKAVFRNESKAEEVLPAGKNVQLHALDIGTASKETLHAAFSDTDAVIWCASGFSKEGDSLDIKGMRELPEAFKGIENDGLGPRIVMLSSAGVSRPAWPEEKKQKLLGASDIPIIRLNPGQILDRKREAEALLRSSDVPYCIVRPTGLKFGNDWPQGRPIFSQGDVAVGRTNAADLAEVLSSTVNEPKAVEKTFEMFTLVGYPPARDGISRALSQLQNDASESGPQLSDSVVEATYASMQQLLPGEEQDATKLEMGRTYEQVDSGAVKARERGAAPTKRELDLASGVGGASKGSKRQAVKRMLQKAFR